MSGTCFNATSSADCYLAFVSSEKDFLECLVNGNTYSPRVFPTMGNMYEVMNGSSLQNLQLTMTIWITLYNVLALTNDGALSLIVDLRTTWNDPNLNCGTSGPKMASPAMIWTPVFRLMNPANSKMTYAINSDVLITHPLDGNNVEARLTTELSSMCREMSLVQYPFDVQTCSIQLITMNALGLVNYRLINENNVVLPGASSDEWQLEDLTLLPGNVTLLNTTSAAFKIQVTLRRNSYYYTLYLIVPMIVMQALVAMVFGLPSDKGAKLGLSASFVVVLFIMYESVVDLTPQFQEEDTPNIVIAIFLALFLSLFSVMESALLQLLHKSALSFPKKLNKFVVWLFVDLCKTRCRSRITQGLSELEIPDCVKTKDDYRSMFKRLDGGVDDAVGSNSRETLATYYLNNICQVLKRTAGLKTHTALKQQLHRENLLRKAKRASEKHAIVTAWKRFEYTISCLTLIVYVTITAYFFGPFLYS